MQHYYEALCCIDLLINSLWPCEYQYHFCTALNVTVTPCTCVMVPLHISRLCAMQMMASTALMITFASRQHRGWDKGPRSVKIKRISVRNLLILGVRLWGFFVCLFSPWDFNVLFCRKQSCSHYSFISQHSNSPVGGRLFPQSW